MIAGISDCNGDGYVYGGRNAAAHQLDCAGYVLEAYWRQGVNLCHVPVWPDDSTISDRQFPDYTVGKFYTSAQRLWDNPRIPHVSEPQPGDLAYWTRTYEHPETITHVMIWVDRYHYVGAQSPVLGEYSNASEWWISRFMGYGRPLR